MIADIYVALLFAKNSFKHCMCISSLNALNIKHVDTVIIPNLQIRKLRNMKFKNM